MKGIKARISAVVLVKNEEKKIGDCLQSLKWCDEIIIVDSGSTDSTLKIVGSFKVKVFNSKDRGFDKLRDLGTRMSTGEWVLHIDADERVTPELKKEIYSIIQKSKVKNQISSYAIPRRNFIFGKEMRHCGLWPDYVQHLIKKDNFISWYGQLHETPKVRGKVGYLKNPLLHMKHNDISEMVIKTNSWSEIEASLMFEAGHPRMNAIRFTTALLREFWLRMIKQTAFMDGTAGIIYAIYQVWSRFISYSKLWEKQIGYQRLNIKD